jgi:hypothetical protein
VHGKHVAVEEIVVVDRILAEKPVCFLSTVKALNEHLPAAKHTYFQLS